MQRLWFAWIGGALARLAVLWAALAAVAWAVSPGGASGAPSRWLSLAAPLALVWCDASWRLAAGPVALGALGRPPILASAALWLSLAPFATLAPAATAPHESALHLGADRLTVTAGTSRPALTVVWTADGAQRADDARPLPGLAPPVPVADVPPLDPGPWRAAVLLVLALGLHRWGLAGETLGLAGGLGAAALTFALGEALPWGLSS